MRVPDLSRHGSVEILEYKIYTAHLIPTVDMTKTEYNGIKDENNFVLYSVLFRFGYIFVKISVPSILCSCITFEILQDSPVVSLCGNYMRG